MAKVHINIGSNLGARKDNILRALEALKLVAQPKEPFLVSEFIESAPWGYASENSYLNLGVTFSTILSPEELLKKCREIEQTISPASHRTSDGNYSDRLIDIDIIAFEELALATARLTLPHPRMHLRDFVIIPLLQTWPAWRHPLLKMSAGELLQGSRENPADGESFKK